MPRCYADVSVDVIGIDHGNRTAVRILRGRFRSISDVSGVEHSVCKEVANHCPDLVRMSLEREVARVEEVDGRFGNVAFERLGTLRQKKGIVLSPYPQEAWLVGPEVILEVWVGRNVALVIAEQIQLDFVGTRTGQIKIIERIAVRRNRSHVRHTVRVLPARRVRREEAAERFAVGL